MQNRLEELRRRRGIKQEELAEAVEVSPGTIDAMEDGSYNPSILLAFKISRYFGLPVEEIFLYEEGQDRNKQVKAYKRRGRDEIISLLVMAILSLLWGCWRGNWVYPLGYMMGWSLGEIPRFIKLRRMTPAEFEAHWKAEKMEHDERAELLSGKSCQVVYSVFLCIACVGAIIVHEVYRNSVAMWSIIGLMILSVVVRIIARWVYD